MKMERGGVERRLWILYYWCHHCHRCRCSGHEDRCSLLLPLLPLLSGEKMDSQTSDGLDSEAPGSIPWTVSWVKS